QFPTGRPEQFPDPKHPGPVETKYVSKYLDVPNTALFPFGHGLSYTTFSYSDVRVSAPTVSITALTGNATTHPVHATAKVTNAGKRRGTEIVQCYVRIRGASVEQPVRSLKGFARVTLDPGESRALDFPLGFEELSFFNIQNRRVIEAADYTVFIGGSSTADLSAAFQITDMPRSR
ncbi:MAG: fibronectin type III-like domain-contianing protein, partial [Acidobacteriaceae bacterium]|nr:fibronectin type III-like domain-contianing protein [Acidobacteriaceae bacterium]